MPVFLFQKFVEKLEKILDDKETRQKISARAERYANERHSVLTEEKTYASLVNAVLNIEQRI